ncbi:MAG: hypothetical protein JXQ85_01405 [Cognatishimia sp.]|uniref:hypothetical protein n=1 Tax=Cognatishimia sp. TaxID=2211648 RepID=UPI003B8D3A21
MRWNEVSQFFHSDGSLRDIIVGETTIVDWEKLMGLSRQIGEVSYIRDGALTALPSSAESIFEDSDHAHCMRLQLDGLVLNTGFYLVDEIEVDIDPREINSQADLDTVLGFCEKLSLTLGRDVSITDEGDILATLLKFSFKLRSWENSQFSLEQINPASRQPN